MCNVRLLFLLVLLPGCGGSDSAYRPFLWSIGGGVDSYLFGTIHLPDEQVLDLPPAVEDALNGCDALMTEIPLDAASQAEMQSHMSLPRGTSLPDLLPPDLWERLTDTFESHGASVASLTNVKIWVVANQVLLLDYLEDYAARLPLDLELYGRADLAGKVVGGLETIEEQVEVFDGLTTGEQTQLLERSLTSMEQADAQGVRVLDGLLALYLAGDEEVLEAAIEADFDLQDPLDRKMMERLYTVRNALMAERILSHLEAGPQMSHFFAVGVGHMVRADGLVARLRDGGYAVERLE